VLAAVKLHAQRGIAATSMKDIATQARVGVGTVYLHFPRYEELLIACGGHLATVTQPPASTIFEGVEGTDRRLQILVREVFRWYQRYPQYERARSDQDKFPMMAEAVKRREQYRYDLVAEALQPKRYDRSVVDTVGALTDFAVYRALTGTGLAADEAATRVSDVVLGWLQSRKQVLGTTGLRAQPGRRTRSH
jgi:AcrR family transcriptional regulator